MKIEYIDLRIYLNNCKTQWSLPSSPALPAVSFLVTAHPADLLRMLNTLSPCHHEG